MAAKDFAKEKDMYLSIPLEEKRSYYNCGDKYVTLKDIPTWTQYFKSKTLEQSETRNYSQNKELNEKISVFVGDITCLEIDAIVNAANKSLMGGGGVDGAIHRAAGGILKAECATLGGCETGDAKITGGYKLPSRFIIHTVGPVGENAVKLESCYLKALTVLKENGLRSIAFPCVSTGVYGYPNRSAAKVALSTVREWLESDDNSTKVDRIIFCLFLPVDITIYNEYLSQYFPV